MTGRPDDDPDVEFSSPACAMHEADDAYIGYVGTEELIAFPMSCSKLSVLERGSR
jgi:hypothetical protein